MAEPKDIAQVQEVFAAAGVAELTVTAYEQFLVYLELLQRWNARLNLTAIRTPEEIIRLHFAECAFAAQHLPSDIVTLLDYGSGAGFPGLVVAVCRPEIRVTLAESHGKKASFLREAVRAVGTATEVYDRRVETILGAREFDGVCMRAVEKMKLAVPLAARLAQKYVVLLTTEQSAPAYWRLTPELMWLDPIQLPNSAQRILSIGQRIEAVGA